MANPVLVEVTRGPPVESIHRGAVASLPIALGALNDEGPARALAHAPVLNTRRGQAGERRVPDGLYAQQRRP